MESTRKQRVQEWLRSYGDRFRRLYGNGDGGVSILTVIIVALVCLAVGYLAGGMGLLGKMFRHESAPEPSLQTS
jgi:hypothetical protein